MRAERGWTLSCGMPGAGHLVPAGRIRTAALNPRSLISRGGACQDGAWELAGPRLGARQARLLTPYA